MKLDLLTNATVVDDAIRFVSNGSKEKQRSYSYNRNEDDRESNEPDYDEDKLEEEETGERTTNQIF